MASSRDLQRCGRYPKMNTLPLEAFVSLEIEFSPEGVCSLWPDLLSVEPGEPPYRFRLNDTLYMKLVTPHCVPLYTIYLNLESTRSITLVG